MLKDIELFSQSTISRSIIMLNYLESTLPKTDPEGATEPASGRQ